MAKKVVWQDDYWLPVLQVYLSRPVGVKRAYSRETVALSMELHVPPQVLHSHMEQLATLSTPRLEYIWQQYGKNPQRLARAVRLWREMRGFGMADEFYEGVELQETFEKDFRPIQEDSRILPVMLILILNLYFQLTPATMVTDTPEVKELARLIKLPVELVVEVLRVYMLCDPFLNRDDAAFSPLLLPCQQVWQRFENEDPTRLDAFAEELKAYFS